MTSRAVGLSPQCLPHPSKEAALQPPDKQPTCTQTTSPSHTHPRMHTHAHVIPLLLRGPLAIALRRHCCEAKCAAHSVLVAGEGERARAVQPELDLRRRAPGTVSTQKPVTAIERSSNGFHAIACAEKVDVTTTAWVQLASCTVRWCSLRRALCA
eukprot:1027995-Pleurochrysis_carterae.AAC.1